MLRISNVYKRKFFKGILFSGYIIFLIFVAELFLRIFLPTQNIGIHQMPPITYMLSNNENLGYELRPNVEDINSDGLRDTEYPIDKDPLITRIVIIGDSIVYGLDVSKEETYSKQLEKKLNQQRTGKYEVLNFGVPGYGTVQILERFKNKVIKYKPDIVVYGYWFNDFHKLGCDIYEKFFL